MAKIDELTDLQAAEFGHAFVRWLIDEDPAGVAHFFPNFDAHEIKDREATEIGRAVLEDFVAEWLSK